ncbi:cytochrome c3 family protein [Geomonas anaerohicana]|uniref:Cytochrome c3 family protein n=1 Tax=Geomonas anaerohicana TaxID=2798583 RepID=A0ABS0YI21_9BACT|nr:cytochrome c3 family protein [Geomonas anaerohicana]MBJ6751564.1 cytochrome c3 family protein [Geomonas anaerohicana]
MRTEQSKKSAMQRMTGLVCAAAMILGLAQGAGAFGTMGSSANSETCAYTLLLQNSVQARRDYLVKVDEVRGSTYAAGGAVDDMYGNVVPANYSDDQPTGGLTVIFKALTKQSTTRATGTLDSLSASCLSCHDGIGASQINVELRDRPLDRRSMVNSFTSDHPVGMTYDAYVAAGRGYKDVGSNTKMLFVNGKVGCLSCHDPLNTEKGHLVMSDNGSALCKTCHDK